MDEDDKYNTEGKTKSKQKNKKANDEKKR